MKMWRIRHRSVAYLPSARAFPTGRLAHRAKTKAPVGSTSDKLKKYRSPILEQAKDTISDLTAQQSYLLELED